MASKRERKNLGRRSLAFFLSLVLMISGAHITAFGAGYPDQTMDGFYEVGEDGIAVLSDKTKVEEDGFTLEKTIEQTGINEFDITLKVVTSQEVITDDAAVQLVIDVSNSMGFCASCGADIRNNSRACSCGAGNRMEAVKAAIAGDDGFLDQLAENNSGSLKVSVIAFGDRAYEVCDWYDISTEAGLAAVKQAVRNMNYNGGTNLEAGLMLARNRWNMDEVRTVGNKYTVLLSDGYPTYRMRNDNTNTESITGTVDGDGQTASSSNISEAKAMAEQVKAQSELYTICYGVGNDSLYSVDECKHCGEAKDDHIRYGKSRYCEGYQTRYEAKGVTIGDFLKDDIATAATEEVTYAFNADDTAQVNAAFADIAESSTEGMNGAGTSVHDPMGQYIILGDVSGLEAEGVIANGNSLIWNLDPTKVEPEQGDDGSLIYTYEVTYPITLDTAARGFEEFEEDGSVKYYPTNGYTYLNVPQESGEPKEIAFLVPGVCGQIPEYEWSVEYYLQDESSLNSGEITYSLDDSKDMGLADLHSSVYVPDYADEEYKNKYADDDYYYVEGNPVMVIGAGENVMKLYYNIITAKVNENHFYKTDRILADGTEEFTSYAAIADKSYEYDAKINTEYSAEPELEYGNAIYELDFIDPQNNEITVYQNGENVINLYYNRLIDERATTSAIVKHIYTTYKYELNADGLYELNRLGSVEETAVDVTDLRATTMLDVSAEPLTGYENFELNKDLGDYADMLQEDGTLSFKIAEDPEDNIRYLYFEEVIDEREAVKVTVNHYYTKTIISYENGEEVVTYDPDGIKGHSEDDDAYAGERYEAFEVYSYDGDIYEADAGNAEKMVIDAVQGGEVIDLYYHLEVRPEKTDLIVNHTWKTFTEVTFELTEEYFDEATSSMAIRVIGTDTRIEETTDHEDLGNEVELFIGEGYEAPLAVWGEGYTFNEDDSNRYGIGGEDDELNLYYYRYADEDIRDDASIDVQHKYYTNLTIINADGETEVVRVPDGTADEDYPEMKAGDEFTAEAELIYNENEYAMITDESALGPVILQPGTNATIVIEYERDVDDRKETEYVVNYEYRTYDMIIGEDGKATYGEPTIETVTGEAISGYVGEKVVLDAGNRAGFEALSTNPATVHFLAEDGNEWTFVHEKKNELGKVNVEVNHHYTTITIAANGESSSSTADVKGAEAELYAGESYTAEAVLNGFELVALGINAAEVEAKEEITVTVDGRTVIDFYYSKTIDNSVPVTWSIKHVYNYYDYDGSLINSAVGDPITSGTGYLGNPLTATPEPNGYELVDAEFNGADLDIDKAEHTVILAEGENKVEFTYELHKERDKVDVKVIHNYYQNEEAITEGGIVLEKYELTETEIFEGEEYTAEKLEKDGFVFHSADPAELKITVTEGEENIIILNYVRAEASYKVVHIYNRNNVEEARTSESFGGYHGDEVKADDIARVPSNGGRNYTFVSISGDIVLDEDEEKVITLVYNRSVSKPRPKPTPTPDPEPTPDPDPIDIPDPEVPLTPEPDLPDEPIEIEEPEVPLADVPKTGDNLALYYASAAISALGLVILALTGKKRKEEEA